MIKTREIFAARFRERLRSAIDQTGMSYKDVSIAARGQRYPKTVANIFSNSSVPGADVVQSLAVVLGVSSDYLLCMPHTSGPVSRGSTGEDYEVVAASLPAEAPEAEDDTANLRPPIDSVLAWWKLNDRKLVRTAEILDYCDIYRRPTEEAMYLQPIEVGPKSLLGQHLATHDISILQDEFKFVSRERLGEVVARHIDTATEKNILTIESLTYATSEGFDVTLEYARLLLAVIGEDGEDDLVLCFTRPFEITKKKSS
ncbi:MAG: hypothetical protein AAFV19_12980 [Pseudomonadota bacterium]